ncbi:hypothetical protein SAMN04487926_13011 [Paraburkholderia steynii]|uniref:Uncharacterized protein n=1 Tax=Paraburkholderia steynii TaxID=1245441 RepID=A0A7Z7FMB3_9BURK|nr:hypothetical protein SAMN04487926_13011 [Paraburkholderia steynii]
MRYSGACCCAHGALRALARALVWGLVWFWFGSVLARGAGSGLPVPVIHPRYEFPLHALPLCRAACLFACIGGLAPWRGQVSFWGLRWHPRVAFVLHALPLCGAACLFASIHGLAAWRGRFRLLVCSLASAFC